MGKYGNGIKVLDRNGNGMGMGIMSLKWEGIGTKNLFPHTSNVNHSTISLTIHLLTLTISLPSLTRTNTKSWVGCRVFYPPAEVRHSQSFPPSPPIFLHIFLEVRPLNPARGYGERCKLSQRGSSSRNRIWRILTLKSDI